MNQVIKKHPHFFGAILLAGCICGIFLVILGAGWITDAYAHVKGDGMHSDMLSILWMGAQSVVGLIYFVVFCLLAFLIGHQLFFGLKHITKALGQWLAEATEKSDTSS